MTMASFTCASCQVVFASSEQQRDHYRSDWHRYNLRRKTSELPPVTEAVFNQRLTGMLHATQSKEREQQEAHQLRECVACRKTFSSEKALESHVRSKKHLEAVAGAPEAELGLLIRKVEKTTMAPKEAPRLMQLDADASEAQIQDALKAHLDKATRLAAEDCIFCSHRADTFEANMEHMTKAHSLYVPDIDYLVDLRGLIGYLGEKVSIGLTCLYCPATIQPFHSLHSVRKHMQDKGHCKVRCDEAGAAEICDFYDFSQSYPTVADDGDEDYEDVATDDEWEYLERQGAAVLSPDGAELMLADGRAIGHRDYRRYYKQNLHASMARESRDRELMATLKDEYAQKGQLSLSHIPTPKSRYDQKAYYDDRKEGDLKMGIKQNGLMKHFRQQLLQ